MEPDWLANLYSYYGYPPYPGMTEITVKNMRIGRATTLLGLTTRNRQRQELGNIRDFTVDVQEGHIAYMILASGGVMGVGEELRAVPWTAMEVKPVERVVVVNIDHEKLTSAPPLDAGGGKRPQAADGWLAFMLITGQDLIGGNNRPGYKGVTMLQNRSGIDTLPSRHAVNAPTSR